MEAKGLSINDWVLYHNTPKQVVYIYCRPLPDGTNQANEIGFTHKGNEWVNASDVEPIRLTEEILKANLFEKRNDDICEYILMIPSSCVFRNYVSVYKMNDGSLCSEIVYHLNEFKVNKVRYLVSSIHELQHALRLCGLNELADNFKLQAL